MKKLLCTGLMLCLLCGTALADAIWAPPKENRFYTTHAESCVKLNRSYYTNGPEGGVVVYDSPGGSPMEVLENGVSLWVHQTYKDSDGADWAIVEYNEDWDSGWIDMTDLLVIYDEQSFREEFAEALQGTMQSLPLAGLDYCMYEYPGGPLRFQADSSKSKDKVTISLLYTDPEGREWGRCGYRVYGRQNPWFCLSDLENPDLPVTEHTYDIHPTGDLAQLEEAAAQKASQTLWFLGGGVALVCGGTAFLIFRMKKQK